MSALRLGLLAVILLTLSGCLFDSQPQPAPPPTATATPRPTPTATAASLRVDRPPPTGVTPPPATSPTAARPIPADLRGAGQILYLGSLNGHQGIIATDADGANRRLLVEGAYQAPVWSPDGSRFAAYGTAEPGNLPDQLAIFNTEGRALARFPFSGVIAAPPAWSPDARTLLCLFFPLSANPQTEPPQALLVDDNGPREIALGPRAIPWRWTPEGRIAFRSPAASQRGNELLSSAIWSLDPAGGTSRLEATGTFIPAGWSPDGSTLYAIGVQQTPDQSGIPADLFSPASLLAFDTRTGAGQVVISADTLAARLSATPPTAAGVRWFATAAVAPVTGDVALWLQARGPAGTPTAGGGDTRVVIADRTGLPLVSETLPGVQPTGLSWSPDGRHLAIPVPATAGFDLHVMTAGADQPLIYTRPSGGAVNAFPPAWSSDGRWIVFAGYDGLIIGSSAAPERAVTLAPDGQAPAWRPAVRP